MRVTKRCDERFLLIAILLWVMTPAPVSGKAHSPAATAVPGIARFSFGLGDASGIHHMALSAALALRTWDGGGSTDNWSEAANWSGDAVPTSADNVVFDATSVKNSVIDVNVETFNLTITAGYTGTISMSPGANATFGNDSTQSGGTFTAGSGTVIFGSPLVGGSLTLSAGILNAGSGTMIFRNNFNQTGGSFNGGPGNVSGRFNITGGAFLAPSGNLTTPFDATFNPTTFSHNNGTVVFTGENTQISIPSLIELNNLTINKNDSRDLTFAEAGRTIRVTGTLSLVEGRLGGQTGSQVSAEGPIAISPTFGNPDSTAGGSGVIAIKNGTGVRDIAWPSSASLPHISLEDANATMTLSGTGPARSGSLWIMAGAVQAGSTDLELGYGSSTIAGYSQSGGSFHANDGDVTLVTGAFQLSAGTFTMVSGNATLPCSLSVNISGGTFNASSGTTTMCTGGGFNGSFTQSAGVFNGGTGTLDINHNFTLSGGTFTASSGATRFGFVFNHQAGTLNHNNGTVVFDSTHPGYSLNNPGTGNFHNVTVDLLSGSVSLSSDNWIANGTLRLVNGSVTDGSLQAKGDVIVESTADGGNAVLTFNGAGAQSFTNNGAPNTTGTWTVNKPVGSALTSLTSMLLGTSQPLNLTSGTLYLGNGSNLTSGVLTISASGQLLSDSATTITLGANPINNGQVVLQGGGAPCPQPDTIFLRSSVNGTRRNWSGSGMYQLNDVDVRDMGGNSATTPAIGVFSGTDSGNNGTNWTFNSGCPIGAPTHVAFTVQPSDATAGQSITPPIQVAIRDAMGQTVPTATSAVTISIANNPASGTLSGTMTRNAVNGVATFDNLSINRSGIGYTLQATSPSLTSATSNPFNINPGPSVKLGFITQPTNSNPWVPITPPIQVAVQDAFGNTVPTTGTRNINLRLGQNPPQITLSGDVDESEQNGIATFSNVSISSLGNGYTIRAMSAGLTEAESDPFDIVRRVFVVTNTNDSGPGSLRQAMIDANGGVTAVHFNIPGAPPHTIRPLTLLPTIATVLVDGTTQPGFAGTPVIEISGELIATDPQNSTGLTLEHLSIVKGLVINRFGGVGIKILNSGNMILGNYIGTDISGSAPLLSQVGISVPTANSLSNQIGGPNSGERNIISGSDAAMIFERSFVPYANNVIQGNYIGTNAAGTASLGGGNGILLQSSGNLIGGQNPGEGNLLSGNSQPLRISGDSNIVQGNIIGPDVTGTQSLPGGNPQSGIFITGELNIIGGDGPAANTIAFNHYGVEVWRSAWISLARGNRIIGNRIHSNLGLGIDLYHGGEGVLPNDPGDIDDGPNDNQNYPVLTAATSSASNTRVQGSIDGNSPSYRIDFYSSPACDPSGHGEAPVHLGFANVTAGSGGIASFDVPTLPPTQIGNFVIATATAFGTSEFSQCRIVSSNVVGISGRVANSGGVPLSGALVRVTGGFSARSTSTDNNGNYSFKNLPTLTNYTVSVSAKNYAFTPPSRTYPNILTDQIDQNFVANKTRFSISGRLVSGTTSIASVRVSLSGGATASVTANGEYRFDNLLPGTYVVTPTKDQFNFSPQKAVITITNADVTQRFNGVSSSRTGRIMFERAGSIWGVDADGTSVGGLPGTWKANGLSVSRDGKKIVYTKNAAGSGMRSLYMSNADGSNEALLLPAGPVLDNGQPELSPDGTKIAFVQVSAGRRSIRIRHADGRVVSVPTSGLSLQSHPTWLSETRIAFSAIEPLWTTSRIYAVNTDGSGLIPLTFLPFNMLAPAASPAGTKIAFNLKIPTLEFGELRVMSDTGGGETSLTFNVVPVKAAWSPDGMRLAYSSGSASFSDLLLTVDSGGGGLHVVHTADLGALAWAPDYEFPTSAGSIVTVDAGGARVTFNGVPAAGTTTFTPTLVPTTPPAPFVLSGHTTYEITTSVAYAGQVTTCLKIPTYIASTQQAFNRLVVLHLENDVLVDRTLSRDFATRLLCAESASLGSFTVASDQSTSSGDGGTVFPSITGVVVDDAGEPLSDVVIRMSGTEERLGQTDSLGRFTFTDLTPGGNFVVQPRLLGYVFNENSQTFLNLLDEESAAFVGTAASFSIGGRIINLAGTPQADVVVSLDGSASRSTMSDSNGNYSFANLAADGSYTVTPFGTGFFNPPSQTIESLVSNSTSVDFVHHSNAPALVGIAGRVLTPEGEPLGRATIVLIGPFGEVRTSLTNPFGYYSFQNVETGISYMLTIERKEATFDSPPLTIFLVDELTNLDFVASP